MDKRREFLEAGEAALREYERTGIAYDMEDVEVYLLAIAAGKKVPRPDPTRAGRTKR